MPPALKINVFISPLRLCNSRRPLSSDNIPVYLHANWEYVTFLITLTENLLMDKNIKRHLFYHNLYELSSYDGE